MDPVKDDAAPEADTTRARRDLLGGVIFAALAVVVVVFGARLPGDSGLFPVFVGLVLLAGAIGSAVTAIRAGALTGSGPGLFAGTDPAGLRRMAIAAAGLVAYALALRPLGYFTTTLIILIALPPLLGYRRPGLILINALITTALLYAVFILLFDRPLPREFFLR